MVNKFVLSRRTQPTEKYLALAAGGLMHDQKIGLKVPHIASIIRKQRLTRLQLLVKEENDSTQLWTILPVDRLHRCMSPYSRHDRWDFLYSHPSFNNQLVQRGLLSPLRNDIWKHWTKIPMTVKTPHEPTIHQMIQMPIWLSSHPLFQVPGRDGTSSLAIKLKNHRDWYRHVARSGFLSLEDFLTPMRTWPTYDEFKSLMTALEDDFVDDSPIPTSFQHFYKLLTLIATNVWTQEDLPLVNGVPRSPEAQPIIVCRHNDKEIPFGSWTSKILKTISFHAPPMTKKHPLDSPLRTDKKKISAYLSRYVKP
ncbi:hypothetical protein AeRB84_008369, partial [Aphanomyces euteiches]